MKSREKLITDAYYKEGLSFEEISKKLNTNIVIKKIDITFINFLSVSASKANIKKININNRKIPG